MSDSFGARCPIGWPAKRRKMSDRCRPESARCPIVLGIDGARCPIGARGEEPVRPQPVCISILVSWSGQNGARCPIPLISNGARCPIVEIERNQGADRAHPERKWGRFLPGPEDRPARTGQDSGLTGPVWRKMSDSFCRGRSCRTVLRLGGILPDLSCRNGIRMTRFTASGACFWPEAAGTRKYDPDGLAGQASEKRKGRATCCQRGWGWSVEFGALPGNWMCELQARGVQQISAVPRQAGQFGPG